MVRVLAVSDTIDRSLYEGFNKERWAREGIELIVSCGDLKPGYLDYLVSVFNVPCFYVRGNHDVTYEEDPPGGCINIDDKVQTFKGVRFFGLEGSYWYNGGPAQYREGQMWWRAFWGGFSVRQAGGIDVLVAHSPPRMCPLPEKKCVCVHPAPGTRVNPVGQPCYVDPERLTLDAADLPHRGFDTLRTVAQKYRPRVFLHGHTHLGYGMRPREVQLGETRVIDCYGHTIVDV